MTIDQALTQLHKKLATLTGDWMLIGTASLYLAGYPVTPNDIDILCDAKAAQKVETILASYRAETSITPNQKFRSRFSQYNFDGIKVEVMGYLEVNTPNGWVLLRDHIRETEVVLFNGMAFNTPAKASQIAIYTLFDRTKDIVVLKMLKS